LNETLNYIISFIRKGEKKKSELPRTVPQLRESFVSNQSRKYTPHGKDHKTQPKHARHGTPEQYKNIFTLEDKLKKIQECKKKDRKKKVKINVAKNEDIIEIDPECLEILNDHTIIVDNSNNDADNLGPNEDNTTFNSESED